MARRDLTGAVDFAYLEGYAAGDFGVVDEVLALFHTIKGAARGVGAFQLGDACEVAEQQGAVRLESVRIALQAALSDVAAYAHERALQSLKTPKS